jgi:hypothetical protein
MLLILAGIDRTPGEPQSGIQGECHYSYDANAADCPAVRAVDSCRPL